MRAVLALAFALFASLPPVAAFAPPSRPPRSRDARARPASLTAMAAEPVKGVAAILLAGGTGSRMKADRPKQFLELEGKPILQHSLDLFFSLEGVETVVLVIDKQYRDDFAQYDVVFADPGK